MRRSALAGLVSVFALVARGAAWADDAQTQKAREELERQLSQMVSIPPPRVEIAYESLDDPNFKLEAIAMELDGAPVAAPAVEKLNGPGTHKIFGGQLKAGQHTLVTRVTVVDASSVMFSYLAGYKWKVVSKIEFETRRGLEVKVTAVPARIADAKDPKQMFRLSHEVGATMTAAVDDGSMPPEPEKPGAKAAEAADAGVAVAAVDPKEAAKAARLAAAEEKKRKAEEAKAAKLAAAEEKQRKAEEKKQKAAEAKAARAAAAAEKQRLAAEAKAARLAALEEKKRAAAEAKAAKLASAKQPAKAVDVQPARATEPVKAVEPVKAAEPAPLAEVVDAGAPVAVAMAMAEPVKPAAVPAATVAPVAERTAEEGGLPLPLPLLIAIGCGLLAVVVFVFVKTRR